MFRPLFAGLASRLCRDADSINVRPFIGNARSGEYENRFSFLVFGKDEYKVSTKVIFKRRAQDLIIRPSIY
jgi:hypothetical protein